MDSSLMFESREEYTYPPYGSSPPYSGSLLQELYDERPHHHAPYYSDVKLEEHQTPLVPSHHYLPASSFNYPPPPPAYSLSPHTGLPVQHTDDAASKETQYLRRRCFNCHTTEPPSWRRSTLNPGKIVCNKCGLYERTHLRPRPLRFDELRAGNKARKSAAKKIVKKDPSRSPKDWDDSLSLYSGTSSSSSSSYPSPSPYSHTLSLPHSPSASPPPIRLPVAQLPQPYQAY